MKFRWKRVFAKEYGTPFGWVSGICILGVYGLWYGDHSLAGDERPVHVLYAIFGVMFVAWALALTLKRSKRLVAD
jgi:hypothetical protein